VISACGSGEIAVISSAWNSRSVVGEAEVIVSRWGDIEG